MSASDEMGVALPSDKQPVSQPAEQINHARRRWVIGALAGPAAVSLPLSASAAAFGSISTCVENSYSDSGVLLHIDASVYDQYARKLVPAILVEKGRSGKSHVLVRYNSGRVYDEAYNEWYSDGKSFISPDGDSFKASDALISRNTLVFADVNDLGQFTAVEPEAGKMGYVPVSTSCYLSIAPLHL